ncbi:hypothetical protein [Roseicella frigidaeris]|uniref:Uncharacterized protein n=1 Tax=Roseicella frigidaeris TaxID=2230885 RepID=A0A327M859_9PROT|nr:hypothetical protein [Roseicella frigidaeris]RAI58657.1 hypothetical protein DOO78_13300 [Roseicella frigidaeris]
MTDDAPDPSPLSSARRQALQDRFQRAKTIAAQAARARVAGGAPSAEEAARLVAEFHAQGGQVTVCPPAEDEPTEKGAKR